MRFLFRITVLMLSVHLIGAEGNEDVRSMIQQVYEQNHPSKIVASEVDKIPRIIHQIWIGPKPPPEYLLRFQKHIKSVHPDWEYHLWTDASLQGISLPDKDLIDKSSNFGTKADIVRCDILEQFGGVCFDADIDVCSSFLELHKKYDFYAGFEPLGWIGVAVIGVKPYHPIIQEWRRLIRANWEKVEKEASSLKELVMAHTYYPFTRAVMHKINRGANVDVVFPSTYFYPTDEKSDETMARHYNAGSWKK